MQVKASTKYLRMSPRKVRLLLPAIRGARPDVALATLRLMPQAATVPLSKVIKSAVANAENNFLLDPEKLIITKAAVDEGPTMRRFMAAARGRAATIHRRSAHITIVVEDSAVVAPKGSVAQKIRSAVAKPASATKTKPASDTLAADSAADEVVTTKKPAKAKTATKATKPKSAPKASTITNPQTTDTSAENTPRRTAQQTGRGATTRQNKPSSGNKGKDKS